MHTSELLRHLTASIDIVKEPGVPSLAYPSCRTFDERRRDECPILEGTMETKSNGTWKDWKYQYAGTEMVPPKIIIHVYLSSTYHLCFADGSTNHYHRTFSLHLGHGCDEPPSLAVCCVSYPVVMAAFRPAKSLEAA
jgi:hypothetical protein